MPGGCRHGGPPNAKRRFELAHGWVARPRVSRAPRGPRHCVIVLSRLEALAPRVSQRAPPERTFAGELIMGYKIAVVGATGNVGREMLEVLAERRFPADEVVPLASRRSQGVEVSYGDATLKCKALDHYDFSDVDICLMSAGSAVSKEWSPRIAAA